MHKNPGWILIMLLIAGACSKSEDGPAPEVLLPPLPPVTVTSSGTYIVNNLPGDTTQTMEGKDISDDGLFKTIYYSLEDGRTVPAEYAGTDKWDIAFAGIYNSSIWANHGEVIFENGTKGPGYGSPARGGLYLVIDPLIEGQYYNEDTKKPVLPIPIHLFEESFEHVKEVPVENSEFLSYGYLALDHFLGSGSGYAYYDFYGSSYPGNPKKAHVVYNLPRTILIKTAKGNYAKLILYSFYKSKPVDPDRDNIAPYLSFKYSILKEGSKDFSKID
ncbi:hypothetical protein SAMN05216436_10167 [bacterium A37T11]|nr:hypothetical protein SAMN05216436_10167 [bacterium A37T11]